MNVGLRITLLWKDDDFIKFEVVARNQLFAGFTLLYAAPEELAGMATALAGFPKTSSATETISLGSFGPKFAGGAASLRFLCRDLAGHTRLHISIEEDHMNVEAPQSAVIFFDFEPAALDRFCEELRQIETSETGTATLSAG